MIFIYEYKTKKRRRALIDDRELIIINKNTLYNRAKKRETKSNFKLEGYFYGQQINFNFKS